LLLHVEVALRVATEEERVQIDVQDDGEDPFVANNVLYFVQLCILALSQEEDQ
jgi:hypothetical protein